ncbi:MAG: MFS transporter, partial [Geobacteraceae bacterium]|nr:MFS transporter [Geobacteraceae bacterium]
MSEQTSPQAAPGVIQAIFSLPVIVAALGYFVDIYDLVLFSIVRVPSLKALGLSGKELVDQGVFLLNMQMIGMLLGGILWGVLGDRKGRLKIMFGSIFLYSIANLANGFADSITAYAVLRFIAGVGLAGELGAGITLVSEVLHKSVRGYGTMIVASVGVSGAILANFIAKSFDWRNAFIIGGILGLCLLALRLGVVESGMFSSMKEQEQVSKGNFLSLFTSADRFGRFLHAILIGLPSWFVVGVLITFSPEFAKLLGVTGAISAGNAVMYCYLGLVAGDLLSGILSQLLKSRKKVVLLFLIITVVAVVVYFMAGGVSAEAFYGICGLLGFGIGYWAIFVTIAAEQFGTNLRATVATTVPNFVRGMTV